MKPGEEKSTTVDLVFYYEGKEYEVQYDFMCPNSWEGAKSEFESGNMACDCNRSDIIQGTYPDFEKLECGNEIILKWIGNIKNPVSDDEAIQRAIMT